MINFDFNITYLNYQNRLGNLDAKALGVVKSSKNFPIFLIDGRKVVFKPLSKTKPLSTPYFAYSEVFWSTIINQYFDSSAPVYKLAICSNYENEFETKYHHGTIVNSIEKQNHKLTNLYEIFLKFKDDSIDIENYINFCEKFYDYTKILDAKIMNDEKNLGSQLAYQILLSILRLDQNYHYENPLFYGNDNQIISIAPPIDHEFSTMFMYLDNFKENTAKYDRAIQSLLLNKNLIRQLNLEDFAILSQNLDKIIEKYPYVVKDFLRRIEILIKDLQELPFGLQNNGYITPFNSNNFMIGHARFKENDETKALILEEKLAQYNPSIDIVSNLVYKETLNTCKILEKEIKRRIS